MKDFIIHKYKKILKIACENGYCIKTFSEFVNNATNDDKVLILRHDIDRISKCLLSFAEFEEDNGIKANYYFPSKIIKSNPDLIRSISEMGHDVGYHYNDLSKSKGDLSKAYQTLKENLEILKEIVPVSSICMDGKPFQMHDNRKLWDHYNYKDFGVLGEIYLDIDYNEFAYYTDTSRAWDNEKFNVRDKVVTNKEWPVYKSTFEMINAIKSGTFPEKAVINIHPEHWTDNAYDWTKKLVWQSFKNVFKFILIKVRALGRQQRLRELETERLRD